MRALTPTRRALTLGLGAVCAATVATPAFANAAAELTALEGKSGGRLGVCALDVTSGRVLEHNADARFLMCSTFKTFAVAAVLARVDRGAEQLDRRIAYGPADLLGYAPVTKAHASEGALSIDALCAAAMELSDNTAANLLLKTLGGPPAVTAFARRLGDKVTRLDRNEPTVNDPHGDLDTTTPRAMAGSMRAILLGKTLSPASRHRLEAWMVACQTGLSRTRGGLPKSWTIGDKTGSGDTETNDVVFARRPGRAPLIVAAFHNAPHADGDARNATLHAVGEIVGRWAA